MTSAAPTGYAPVPAACAAVRALLTDLQMVGTFTPGEIERANVLLTTQMRAAEDEHQEVEIIAVWIEQLTAYGRIGKAA